MRKSAAPSVMKLKRSQFTTPYAKNENENCIKTIKKTTDHISTLGPHCTAHMHNKTDCNSIPNILKSNNNLSNSIWSPAEELQFESACNKGDEIRFPVPPIPAKSEEDSVENEKEISLTSNNILAMNNLGEKSKVVSHHPQSYNVVWCKRSSKKHKKWEGDAILTIKGCTAILKDMEGKELAKGLGYRIKEVTDLCEGSKFFISGKECEIQSIASEKDCAGTRRVEESRESKRTTPVFLPTGKRFHPPVIGLKPAKSPPVPNQPRDPTAVYMTYPSFTHQWDHNTKQQMVTDVKIDSLLSKHLRPHQKEGIIFMYECIMGFRDLSYQGVILGDEMGLGKTLQCITLIWTLYKQGPYGGKPILKKVLIITPSSLVKNWQVEFFKWLGHDRIPVFAVSQNRKVAEFIHSNHAILIISYEMYVRSADMLQNTKFDLVICDEGHRLKNMNIKTSNVILNLPTMRRILLTGTPIQNDLGEFYSIVEFVNPGILGSASSFRRVYEDPITRSRYPGCTEDERILGEDRAAELAALTGTFLLRRTQEVINRYLPPKIEVVVFCQPSDFQCTLYQHLLGSRDVQSFLSKEGFGASHSPLAYIITLRKLCNHPNLLKVVESESSSTFSDSSVQDHMQLAYPTDYTYRLQDSGKMRVVENLLFSLFSLGTSEKIVLVSNFVQTLDLLENLCKSKQYNYLRLDGSTNSSTRLDLVDKFNSPHSKICVFLLSCKAGGLGLNLIGASRILLYDIDWNPATDLQAMARVWRDGQKKVVYVYRLLTAGTVEEKMYQRQISKQELYGTITDTSTSRKAQFSNEELKDLFTFHKGVKCQTHDILKCSCLISNPDNQKEEVDKENIENLYKIKWRGEPEQKKNATMDELLKWKHVPGISSMKELQNSCLEDCGDLITFLFVNTVNFSSTK